MEVEQAKEKKKPKMTVRVRNGMSFRRNKKKKKLKKETRWIKEETDISKWCVMLAGGCLKMNKEKVSTQSLLITGVVC